MGSAIGLKWWNLLDVAFGIYKGLIPLIGIEGGGAMEPVEPRGEGIQVALRS